MNILRYLLISILLLNFGSLASAKDLPMRVAGEAIVQLKVGFAEADLIQLLSQTTESRQDVHLIRVLSRHSRIYHIGFDHRQLTYEDLEAALMRKNSILYIQPEVRLRYRNTTPDDPLFEDQWHLDKVRAPEAWDITTGGVTASGDSIVVALIDSGCSVEHEDLADNIWINHADIPGDRIDNDGNGYVDDYYGWNTNNDDDVHPDGFHGCATGGLIGARGNNELGVAGINWQVKIMMFSGADTSSEIIQVLDYIYQARKRYNDTNGREGAYVVVSSHSAGLDGQSCDGYPIWGAMYDTLGSAGVLSVVSTTNENGNIDQVGDMPTDCPSDFMIAVTNSDRTDRLVSGAGYSPTSIDLSAPGVQIYTTKSNNRYGLVLDGTSWSTPLVAGSVALLYSIPSEELADFARQQPVAAARQIKKAILDGVDVSPSLEGKTVSGGRLNLYNAALNAQEQFGSRVGPLEILKVYPNPNRTNRLSLEYQRPGVEAFTIRVYNALGQYIYGEEHPEGLSPRVLELELPELASGVYFISLETVQAVHSTSFLAID